MDTLPSNLHVSLKNNNPLKFTEHQSSMLLPEPAKTSSLAKVDKSIKNSH